MTDLTKLQHLDNAVQIPRADLRLLDGNPNTFSKEKYARLRDHIEKHGILIPLLVRRDMTVADGEHRLRIAEELGIDPLPAVVDDWTDEAIRTFRVALSGLRGQLDLHKVAMEARDLSNWAELAELEIDLGYDTEELSELLDIAEEAENGPDIDVLGAGTASIEREGDAVRTKPWEIVLQFEDKAVYQKVRKMLRKAAGKDGTLTDGILRLME